MNYYADSECWTGFYLFIAIDDDGNEYAITDPYEIIEFFEGLDEEDLIVTKNGLGYDWPMWLKLMKKEWTRENFTKFMRDYNDEIIEGGKRFSSRKIYRYLLDRFPFATVDIQELWNMYASLKRAVGAMGFQTILDSPISFSYEGEWTDDLKRDAIRYGLSDCYATKYIYQQSDKELKARTTLENIYGYDVRSLGRPRLVEEIIERLFEDKTGLNPYGAKEAYFREANIYRFGDILRRVGKNSTVKFSDPYLIEFQELLCNYFREADEGSVPAPTLKKFMTDEKWEGKVPPLKDQFQFLDHQKLDITLDFQGKHYRFKEGGIHLEYEGSPQYFADDRYALADIDFDAFYPSMLLKFDIFPTWMEDAGFDIRDFYSTVVKMNLEEKYKVNGDKDLREAYKIISNLYYGKYGESFSIVGDGRLQLKTCLTGQLILLKLVEVLEAEGIEVIYANTDGLAVRYPRGRKTALDGICEQFTKALGINIEPIGVLNMWISNTNSYVWQYENGKVKGKKEYSWFTNWRNPTLKYPIVKKAAIHYLVNNIPIEQTIKECDKILDFCEVKVAGSKYKMLNTGKRKLDERGVNAYLNTDQVFQHTVRYYHSTSGNTLVTVFKDGSIRKHQLANSVTMALDLPSEIPQDLDYDFYIDQAKKLVKGFTPAPMPDDLPF